MDDANVILGLLYDRRDFISMHELAGGVGDSKRLGRALEELNRRGHQLDRQPDRGVRLVRPVRLDAYLVERGLNTDIIGRSVVCFDLVDSTNDVAMASAAQPGTGGLVVTAQSQRMGRGRRGSRWISPPGAGLLFSVLLTDAPEQLDHEAATIAAGLAVAEGIEESTSIQCDLKWPNDVRIGGLKVAGVLTDSRQDGAVRATAIGIGVNVTASPPRDQIGRPATHVSAHCQSPEPVELLRSILRRLDYWRGEIISRRYAGLHDEWVRRCGMIHQRVRILSGGVEHVGRTVDISPLEGLILARDDGAHVHLHAAVSTVLD
ncbi:MAG: biotin--[acetyl-CoA-carboxylase] ligase [Phycisphaerae bacterium]|jgi:BirA family biotin operon repressor/biotin-[acetyl-CoA-carboxylase] ligase|nr:biotin--[acetyl-CoA-carboxylase] ligase [Phycisphaerae bacterium]